MFGGISISILLGIIIIMLIMSVVYVAMTYIDNKTSLVPLITNSLSIVLASAIIFIVLLLPSKVSINSPILDKILSLV